jgi:hypothetical protein
MTASVGLTVVAAVLSAVALIVAALAISAARRSRQRCESLEASFAALRREVELVASISVRTGRRVQRVEHGYSDVAERVEVVESRGPAGGSGSLDQAIDWARRGADAGKLAQQFGLSSGEADLVARLYGSPRNV